jgi:hypothetical protein
MNKKLRGIIILLITVLFVCLNCIVFAGSYTNANSNINSSYDRDGAQYYATKYYMLPNEDIYIYIEDGDCTNFVSQCLGDNTEGGALPNEGIPPFNTAWSSWYYYGDYPTGISHSWTYAETFRYHWANIDDEGHYQAYKYIEYESAQDVLDDWSNIIDTFHVGDVISLTDPTLNPTTHHTMIINDIVWNPYIQTYDLYYAQHTSSKVNTSLLDLLDTYVDQNYEQGFCFYEIKNGE